MVARNGQGNTIQTLFVAGFDSEAAEAFEVIGINHVCAICSGEGSPISDTNLSKWEKEVSFDPLGEEWVLVFEVVPGLFDVVPKSIRLDSQGLSTVLQGDARLLAESQLPKGSMIGMVFGAEMQDQVPCGGVLQGQQGSGDSTEAALVVEGHGEVGGT
jgi:hypothetical protein